MQGFNRYIPPDYDPKKNSTLNSYQGKKHALGVRAKDIDKGILVVRFELPFNIWCGSCNAHIGAGVRYNAQKRKVGNYYSTPIFAFRCKCHLCSGWFEIRTDPQNSRYIVHEGAKQKAEDWDPEEYGGFAVHDTEKPSASEPSADPFGQVEKTVDQQTWAKQKTSRLTELTQASSKLSSDPYAVSTKLRRRFREEKKVLLAKQKRDESVLEKYGLDEGIELGDEEVAGVEAMWSAARENRGLPISPCAPGVDIEVEVGIEERKRLNGGLEEVAKESIAGPSRSNQALGSDRARNGKSTTPSSPPSSLVSIIRKNTAKRYNPFSDSLAAFSSGSSSSNSSLSLPRIRGKVRPSSTPMKNSDTSTIINKSAAKNSVSKALIGKAQDNGGNMTVGKKIENSGSDASSYLLAGYESD